MSERKAEPIDRARDEIARGIEADYPGITVSHGLYGWQASRDGAEICRAVSAPGLLALLPFAGPGAGMLA